MQKLCSRNKFKYTYIKNNKRKMDDKSNKQSAKIKKTLFPKKKLDFLVVFCSGFECFQSRLSLNFFVNLFRFHEFFHSGLRWVVH